MMKKTGGKNFFLKFLTLLLAIGWSTSAVMADGYYRIKIVPICENGATGSGFAITKNGYNSSNLAYYNYIDKITKENLWQPMFNSVLHQYNDNTAEFYIFAAPGDKHSDLVGWYWDEA